MNYEEKISEILEKNMSERGFKLWSAINSRLANIWDKLASSSKKYHKRSDGSVPTIAEHTYEMLYAAVKLLSMFNVKKNTVEADVLLLSIALHDSLKYGHNGNNEHTDKEHDRRVADMVKSNKETFLKLFSEKQYQILEESVRFHSGRWSTDTKNPFSFNELHQETMFVHMLDMLSTADLIKQGD